VAKSIMDEVLAAVGLKPGKGQAWLQKVADACDNDKKMTDDKWADLSKGAQKWVNAAVKANTDEKDIPDFPENEEEGNSRGRGRADRDSDSDERGSRGGGARSRDNDDGGDGEEARSSRRSSKDDDDDDMGRDSRRSSRDDDGKDDDRESRGNPLAAVIAMRRMTTRMTSDPLGVATETPMTAGMMTKAREEVEAAIDEALAKIAMMTRTPRERRAVAVAVAAAAGRAEVNRSLVSKSISKRRS
jgi:hypothetical protein